MRTQSRGSGSYVVAVLAACAAASSGCGGAGGSVAQGSTAATTTSAPSDCAVTLHLAWPESLSAQVTGEDLTESSAADGSAPMRGLSPSDLKARVRGDATGWTIGFEVAGRTRVRSQGFAPELGGVRPVVHIARDGQVDRVTGADAMAAGVRAWLAAGQIDGDTAAMVSVNATDAAQLDNARAHWEWMTRVWNGRSMRCGEPVRETAPVPAMVFSPSRLTADLTLTYVGPSPCPGGRGGTCATLVLNEVARPDSIRDALRAQMRPGDPITSGTLERRVELVVEPDTLVPHAVTFDERVTITRGPGGPENVRLVHDQQAYRFAYRTAGAL